MIRIPEKRKKIGLCYAGTHDGVELPVVDVTHPAFAEEAGLEELKALAEKSLRSLKRAARFPSFLARLAARRSVIMRGTLGARGTFLDGMTTYLYKLGPENLGSGYATGLDRALNRGFGPVSARLRHREVARLCADSLAQILEARPKAALRMLNLGGGAATDSLNALILLTKEAPEKLAGRRTTIDVLDLDSAGPAFGARALEALRGPGASLSGIDVLLRHLVYDWTRPGPLRQLHARLRGDEALVCSSEGGLFEYGEDRDVVENLRILCEGSPADARVIGSAVRPEPACLLWSEVNRMPFKYREIPKVGALAGDAGWKIERTAEGHLAYEIFVLKKLKEE